MTREEAIDLLDNLIGMVDDNHDSDYDTAIKMAIKALEQEPCDDTVSRGVFKQVMWERDTAIEQLRKLGYELGQKIEPCDDAVSRQAVNDLYDRYHPRLATHVYEFGEELKALPSVTPKREQSEWILNDNQGMQAVGYLTYHCSKCGREICSKYHGKTSLLEEYPYCHCGAEMGCKHDTKI